MFFKNDEELFTWLIDLGVDKNDVKWHKMIYNRKLITITFKNKEKAEILRK